MAPSLLLDPVLAVHHRWVRLPRAVRLADAIARHVGGVASFLDVGAGDGRVAALVAERVGAIRAVGVDVHPNPDALVGVERFDGRTLPFPDAAFDVALLCDVLHHCLDPRRLLGEALRVARRVVVKDHLAQGRASRLLLEVLDRVGNASQGVAVPATYFDVATWAELARDVGAEVERLEWPLRVHAPPLAWLTGDALHFLATARRRPSPGGAA